MHPLELNDKLAFETIKTVRLDFLTEEAKAPIPRCQALPSHAFSKLTGRSILVSLSHGWFFQTHPDPNGEKLDLIRNLFAPQLRERYPHTDIQVFFDFLASPQRPRTTAEDEIFAVAMDRMNSIFFWCDVSASWWHLLQLWCSCSSMYRSSLFYHSCFVRVRCRRDDVETLWFGWTAGDLSFWCWSARSVFDAHDDKYQSSLDISHVDFV